MKKILLAALCALFIFFGTGGVPTFSQTVQSTKEIDELNKKIQQNKDKIKQLEDTIGSYKKTIEAKQLEAVSLQNQLSIIDTRIDQVGVEIQVAKDKLETTRLELDLLNFGIADKTKELERHKAMLQSLIKNIHSDDQKNTLEILLTEENLAIFFSQLKNLEDVYSDVGRATAALRTSRGQLMEKQVEVSKRKKNLEDYTAELNEKRQDLNEQMNARKGLLADTRSSEKKYQTLLDGLKREYQSVENEVRSYEEQVRKKLAEQEKIKTVPVGDVDFVWPVPSRYITARFRDPSYPYRRVFEHNAIDIRAAQGTPVKAASSGYVGQARRCTSSTCYAYVLLIHTSNLSTVYGHLSSILVSNEQYVNKGDIIGYSGGTPGTVGAGPFVTGAHLHFEVRLNGIPVDPLGYLAE